MSRRTFICIVSLIMVALTALALTGVVGCGDKESDKPRITSVSPNDGAPGAEFEITGTNFGASQGKGSVYMGDQRAGIVSWADEKITATVPKDLADGSYNMTVMTDAGESNEMPFKVAASSDGKQDDGKQDDRKQGEVEFPTPVSAMLDYMKKNGMDTTGYTFSVYKISNKDPNWKIDIASKTGQSPIYFVLHKVDGNWTVVDHGNAFTAAELQADGLPDDLVSQVPEPAPTPETQAQAVWNYIKNQGGDPSGVVVKITRESPSNGAWELGTSQKPNQPENLVVFQEDANKNWSVKAFGQSIPLSTIEGLKAPGDLAPTQEFLTEFLRSERQSDIGNWTFSLSKVSSKNPDWEVVAGTTSGEPTLYFMVQWGNGKWTVRDYDTNLQPNAVSGQPSDIP